MNMYCTEIELGDETRKLELHYELEDHGLPFIYNAVMIQRVCPEDGIWYDEKGESNPGPHDLKMSITGFLSPHQTRFYAEQIQQELLEQWVDYSREDMRYRFIMYLKCREAA